MRSGTWRHLYDICFIGIVAVLAYTYRGLYTEVRNTIEPFLQAYTPVGMLLLGLVILLILNYLREAIAATFIAIVNRISGNTPLSTKSGKQASNVLRTAKRLQRKGDFQAAGEAFESLEMWRDAAVVYERGKLYSRAAMAWEKAQNTGRAIELFELDGNFEMAAHACLAEGIIDRAQRNYRLAADTLFDQNQLVRAAEYYEKAEDFSRAAAIYEQAHKFDRALIAYERAGNADKILEILKSMPPADYLRRGSVFTQLVERCAEVLNRAGKPREAAEILEGAHAYTRAAEIYATIHMPERAAELYLQADQPEMAEAAVTKITQPDNASELLARLAIRREDWAAAGEFFEKAGKKAQAVDAYKKARDFEAAARIYEEIGRFILAGEMYSSAKNFPAAANAYAKAYDWRNAAECFVACNDLPQAVEAYANAANYLEAGRIALKLTDYARAVEYLQRIPSGAPDAAAGTAFLATAFFYQGHQDMAYELFVKSMDKVPLTRENLPAWYAWARYLEKYDPKQSLMFFRQMLGVDVHYSDVADRVHKLEQVVTNMSREGRVRQPTPKIVQQARPEFTPPVPSGTPVSTAPPLKLNPASVLPTNITGPNTMPAFQTANPPADQHPIIAGRYQIESPTRNFGRVIDYSAEDIQSGYPVGLRTFPRPKDPMVFESTMEMIAAARQLSHPGMATVLASGEDGDLIYIASESTEGQSLQQVIRTKGPMSVVEARKFFIQLLEVLDYAHSNDVCHLNLRPDVIIKDTGDGDHYTVTGFGVPVRQPMAAETVYTADPDSDPQYMAPEQIMGSDVDCRTDIYAVGLLLFFVLTGRTPFEAKRVQDTQEIARMQVQTSLARPSSLRATLPPTVDEVFLKCVYKSPTSRYQSIQELLDDLNRVQPTPLG